MKTYQYEFPLNNGRDIIFTRHLQEVPCYLEKCNSCDQVSGYKLSKDIKYIVFLDTEYVINYFEILSSFDDIGFVISLSSLIYIQFNNKKISIILKKLIEDPSKSFICFQNEFHADCMSYKGYDESILSYYTRLNFKAAKWYLNHIGKSKDVFLLTSNSQIISQYDNSKMDVDNDKNLVILSMKDFVNDHVEENHIVREQVLSLEASLALSTLPVEKESNTTIKTDPNTGFSEYLSEEVIRVIMSKGGLIRGAIRVNKFRSRDEAVVLVSESNAARQKIEGQKEIIILGTNRNRAVHGDMVFIQIFPESKWINKNPEILGCETTVDNSEIVDDNEHETTNLTVNLKNTSLTPTGQVVGIYERNWRDYICSFEPSEMNKGRYVLVRPYDRRIPPIRISVSNTEKLRDHRFIVRIDSWPLDSKYPNGHYVETIGRIGDLETETKTLLIEYSLYNKNFTNAQLAELPINTPEIPYIMDPEEVKHRKDLRNQLIFSIDPIGCQDVDDTLSVRKLEDGGYELGVHIADVSYFVKSGSLLDMEARKRSTSIYMADRRFDMLPHVLSGDLCSLWSGVDRFAVSVMWRLNEKLDVVSVDYFRSIIKSRYKLHYELAQDIHDEKVDLKGALEQIPELKATKKKERVAAFNELKEAIRLLQNIAIVLKSRREAGGGLQLEGVEVSVQFSDPDRTQLENLCPKQPIPMHETIAECMIFANHWVATRIHETYPNRSCLRRHPPPRMDRFSELLHCAKMRGFNIATDSNMDLAKSLNDAVDPQDAEFNKILRSLATLAMSNAEYFSTGKFTEDDFYHYGLALPKYTHFTSPIRRYSDIIVHRLLLCALGNDAHTNQPIRESELLTSSSLDNQCEIMNHQHHQAQLVQRASVELFQALFFKNRQDTDQNLMEGIIVQLKSNGFVVQIPRYGLRGSVYLKKTKPNSVVAWSMDPSTNKPMGIFNNIQVIDWLSDNISIETDMLGANIVNQITVTNLVTSQTEQYSLFDHVVLQASINDSRAHGITLQLDLIGRISKSESNQNRPSIDKEDLFKTVRQFDDLTITKRKYVDDSSSYETNESLINKLHTETSMAHLFYSMKQHLL